MRFTPVGEIIFYSVSRTSSMLDNFFSSTPVTKVTKFYIVSGITIAVVFQLCSLE